MELQGAIKAIGQTLNVTQSFAKRELIIQTNEQYPQVIALEFQQDKCSILDKYRVGQQVKVGINLRGREWTNSQGEAKYFNTIVGWRIEDLSSQSAVNNYQANQQQTVQQQAAQNYNPNVDNDLPF